MSTITLSCSISLNALCAGGMFTFPLMSSSLTSYLKLNQTQLTTIVLSGMISQYPVAVVVGWLIDHHGPSLCALIGGLMFASGYTAFAWEVETISSSVFDPSPTTVYRLSFYFLLIGLGTVFSYLSSLFAASKYFPNHIGLASGSTMALFGLSPLFLSVMATTFFVDQTGRLLDVPAYLYFLSTLSILVNFSSSFNLYRIPLPTVPPIPVVGSPDHETDLTEHAPLLDPERNARAVRLLNPTTTELIRLPDFWLLAIFCVLVLGTSEMIISSIGSIVSSLPPASIKSLPSQQATAIQVKLISLANTLSRMIVGPLADLTSPLATGSSHGILTIPRKHVVSRFVFLSGAALLLACTLLWMKWSIYYQDQVWLLSVGTGFSYSAVFTILPSLISSLWGIQDLGRNFGLMMYAPFIGTPLFSYLYALVSVLHTDRNVGICEGRQCWEMTMSFCTVASVISLMLSLILWRRWQGTI